MTNADDENRDRAGADDAPMDDAPRDHTVPGDAAHRTQDLDELLGAYALDAVDDDERRRVEEYLEVNPRAAAEVRDHREVATLLAYSGTDAPDGLWGRIAAELDDAPPAAPPLGEVLSLDESRRRRRITTLGPLVGAAAAAVVVTVATVALLDRTGSSPDPVTEAIEAARQDRESSTTELTSSSSDATAEGVVDQDGHGYIDATQIPTLGDSRTYQLWGVMADTGDVISLGILGPRPEVEPFTVEGSVTALAVTIEDSPGVISDGNPDGAFVGELG